MESSNQVIKRYGVNFFHKDLTYCSYPALTLPVSSVSSLTYESENDFPRDYDWNVIHSRTHPSDWTISAKLHTNYFLWVNEFEASHPRFGRVWGNFEKDVYADSEEGFAHFYENHQPKSWDYDDI